MLPDNRFLFREKFLRKSLDEQAKRVKEEETDTPAFVQEEITGSKEEVFPVFPRYFEVEGHAGYLFAEYEDRYELFRRNGGGWDYIRTDYKEKAG